MKLDAKNRNVLLILFVFAMMCIVSLCLAQECSITYTVSNDMLSLAVANSPQTVTGIYIEPDCDCDSVFVGDSRLYEGPVNVSQWGLIGGQYGMRATVICEEDTVIIDSQISIHRLALPDTIYVVAGREYVVNAHSFVTCCDLSTLRLGVSIDVQHSVSDSSFVLMPTTPDIGEHTLRVSVQDSVRSNYYQAECQVVVTSAVAGMGDHRDILIIGDSISQPYHYPVELYRKWLNSGCDPYFEMYGSTSYPSIYDGEVKTEAHSGMTWRWYTESEESPFVFGGVLDMGRYIQEQCMGAIPDVVMIYLGTNGTYNIPMCERTTIDEMLDYFYFEPATTLLAHIRSTCPDAVIGLGLMTTGNMNDESGCPQSWLRIQRYLNSKLVTEYPLLDELDISLVNLDLGLDPYNDILDNVHPNYTTGREHTSESAYNWFKNAFDELDVGHTLPVELSMFNAACTNEGSVTLTWVSQTETNLQGYYIYRSDDDNIAHSRRVSEMIAATNTSNETTYRCEDRDVDIEGHYCYWLQCVELDGESNWRGPVEIRVSSPGQDDPLPPTGPNLVWCRCYPNPFNPSTVVMFHTQDSESVTIKVFNLRGQLVDTLVQNRHYNEGEHRVEWLANDDASGIYIVRVESNVRDAEVLLVSLIK